MMWRRLFLLPPLVLACSNNDVTQDAGPDATTDVASDVSADAPAITDAGTDGCSSLGEAGCRSCCETAHPTGAATFATALRACICEPDKCLDACAPTCNGDAAVSQQCGTCAQQVSAVKGEAGCQDSVGAACTAQPDCVAYFGCVLQCP